MRITVCVKRNRAEPLPELPDRRQHRRPLAKAEEPRDVWHIQFRHVMGDLDDPLLLMVIHHRGGVNGVLIGRERRVRPRDESRQLHQRLNPDSLSPTFAIGYTLARARPGGFVEGFERLQRFMRTLAGTL